MTCHEPKVNLYEKPGHHIQQVNYEHIITKKIKVNYEHMCAQAHTHAQAHAHISHTRVGIL